MSATAELAGSASSLAAGQRSSGGQLLGVCGLGGAAGTSTLAQLLAIAAARAGPGPVLLADTGGPLAALAGRCGAQAPLGLADAAEALARAALDRRPFCELEPGLRLLARGPIVDDGDTRPGLEQLLEQASRAHALSVIDCGTLQRPIEQQTLGLCGAVVWVSGMGPGQLERAGSALAALAPIAPRRQLLAVREPPPGGRRGSGAAERRASSMAERCALPVVLVPALGAERSGGEFVEAAVVELAPQLEALIGALR